MASVHEAEMPAGGQKESGNPKGIEETVESISPTASRTKAGSAKSHSHDGSGQTEWMRRLLEEEPDAVGDSSADESTAIFSRERTGRGDLHARRGYGATSGGPHALEEAEETHAGGTGIGSEEPAAGAKSRKADKIGKKPKSAAAMASRSHQEDGAEGTVAPRHWWQIFVEKYGGVELDNKGSVARDHLALERTFLAWVRTSLSFASIGIAVTQLFRLNVGLGSSGGDADNALYVPPDDSSSFSSSPSEQQSILEASSNTIIKTAVSIADQDRLRKVGKPLGATFIGISMVIMLVGFHRYFEAQHYVIRGKFPASRGSIFLVTFVTFSLILASFIVVLALAPSAIQK